MFWIRILFRVRIILVITWIRTVPRSASALNKNPDPRPDPHQSDTWIRNRIRINFCTYSSVWAFIWRRGSGSGSASGWKVGPVSGSASNKIRIKIRIKVTELVPDYSFRWICHSFITGFYLIKYLLKLAQKFWRDSGQEFFYSDLEIRYGSSAQASAAAFFSLRKAPQLPVLLFLQKSFGSRQRLSKLFSTSNLYYKFTSLPYCRLTSMFNISIRSFLRFLCSSVD